METEASDDIGPRAAKRGADETSRSRFTSYARGGRIAESPPAMTIGSRMAHDARHAAAATAQEETGHAPVRGEEHFGRRKEEKFKHICITLLRGSKGLITGSIEQVEHVAGIIGTVLESAAAGILLSVEAHEDGNLHMHGLVECRYGLRKRAMTKLRRAFDDWLGSTVNQSCRVPENADARRGINSVAALSVLDGLCR